MGGDCLNVGCVPSKGLISAARAAAAARRAGEFGVRVGGVEVDFAAVMERMRRLRAGIAPNDGVERFTKLGVDVFFGQARFTGPGTVEVEGRQARVRARGDRHRRPGRGAADPGARGGRLPDQRDHLLAHRAAARLLVIGAGPIGCEMAQAFARFGTRVTVLDDGPHVLPARTPMPPRSWTADGGRRRGAGARRAHHRRGRVAGRTPSCASRSADAAHEAAGDHVLVAVGRAPNVEGLGLEAAGVRFERARRGRSTTACAPRTHASSPPATSLAATSSPTPPTRWPAS